MSAETPRPATIADFVALATGSRSSAVASAVPPRAETDHMAAILGSTESCGRESLARHLVSTNVPTSQAIKILAASPRSAILSAAVSGAASARIALGLPADPSRDAEVARRIESIMGSTEHSVAAVLSDEEEFQRGAESARRLLGKS